ncbi:MAG: lytic transglycosylase domain-containing protein [Sterolibacteriaceae bacterium MAG5]|nr:lytic transglycosylase domain-containing protein [Candidatus Nitricoxidireducens bremensis]
MKRLAGILIFLPLLAAADVGDDKVLAAREAFRNGERVRLAKSVEALKGHELLPWAEYWQLRLRIEDSQSEGVAEFLQRESGSYIAEKLRSDWLKAVGKRREWEPFRSEYPKLVQPDQEVACYALQARLADQQDRTALDEARPLWFSLLDMPDSCLPLMEQLILEQRIDSNDAWARLRRLLEGKKLSQAKLFARYLPKGQEPDGKLLDTIADRPARYIARLPANFAATRLGREMALYAIQRMARSDPETTAAQWRDIEDRFPAAERAYAWGQIAWQAALRHLPDALAWYEKAAQASPTTPLGEEQIAWKARAALRTHDWTTVRRTIEQMPPQLAGDPAWVYWLARALASHGRQQEANLLYQKIGGQPNFYGNLADEELGRSVTLPAKAAPPTAEELAQAAANPALRRALALMRLDIRIEGVREWNWTVRGMNDRQLLAAAEFARKHDVFDRAISTADRTLAQHDYGLRYLAPYREYVEPKARELALDYSWVYGLMRQESRFVTNARSTVGAKGLMQVMPATAKWVAKKINMPRFHPARVAEMDTNVTLGTNYLKMVLESLDNHPVLASAAYNAGPGRARRWRAEHPLEGAIYAETIPFNETRDYVKKVMSNAIYYAALFDEKPQSLKSRLGVVRPKGNGDTATEELP